MSLTRAAGYDSNRYVNLPRQASHFVMADKPEKGKKEPILITSSGHIVGRQPKPKSEAGRLRVVIAVLALLGVIVVVLGGLGTATRLEADHVVVRVARQAVEPVDGDARRVVNRTRR